MRKDIENRPDIDTLMVRFYERAVADKEIGFLFTDVVHLDLKHHLPVIGDFWETVLFGTGEYQRHGRNPLQIHAFLHQKSLLTAIHFRRWLELFEQTVDESFSGGRAEFIKLRARAIANRFSTFLNETALSAA